MHVAFVTVGAARNCYHRLYCSLLFRYLWQVTTVHSPVTVSLAMKKRLENVEQDDDEQEWRRVLEHNRTCATRQICAAAVVLIYVFILLSWRLNG